MVANMLECTPNETIILDGYADPVGNAAYNADLSKRRAVAVRDQLVEFGISQDRILLGAFGEHGATGQGPNQADRRVEVRSSSQPVAELIEARKGNAVAIVSPDGSVQGQQQTARPNVPPQQPPEG
jgi:OOP family OmpA-OmpF porin